MDNKILTVCQRGNSRSATLAYILKDKKRMIDIIAIGYKTTSKETWDMMGTWANKIYAVGGENVKNGIPDKFQDKVVWFNIGTDKWGAPYKKELIEVLKKELEMENKK